MPAGIYVIVRLVPLTGRCAVVLIKEIFNQKYRYCVVLQLKVEDLFLSLPSCSECEYELLYRRDVLLNHKLRSRILRVFLESKIGYVISSIH